MQVSRRAFLKYCSTAAAALGISQTELVALAGMLRNPAGPTVIWLEGLACSGCSVSLLNHIATTAPVDIADVLLNVINLRFHGTLMAAAGQTAVDEAYAARDSGSYILVVEGGVPTAFGGHACMAWDDGGTEVTLQQALQQFAPGAAHIVCVGECSSFGGIAAAGANPAGVISVKAATSRNTINIAGCPPHPYWMIWTLAQLVSGNSVTVDAYGRPTMFFSSTVHSNCPLRNAPEASNWGQETYCKEELGCRGPSTRADCPSRKFNGGVNWCIGSGAHCIGCTSTTFPGTGALYTIDD